MASLLNHVWSGLDFWDKEENKKQRQQYAAQQAAQPRPQVQQPQIQRPVSYAPQPLQQRVNQSYGSGISSITNRFRDLLDANTEADKIKRFAQSGLNETYNQQQDRLNQQSLNAPVHRSGVNQAVGNFLGGAAEITKLPAQMGNLASAVQQSHNPLIRGVVTVVNPSLGISSWLPKNKNQQKNIEAGQRMSQQTEQLIGNKIQQSGLGERSTDNPWIAKPTRVGGQIGSQLAAAAATGGGSTVGAMIPTVQVASGSYDAARNAGFNNDKALGVAGLQGVLTGVTSKVGLGNIAGEFGAGRNILTNALQKTLIGGADMGAQQFASNVINKLTYNPNQNLMDGVKQAVVTGGIVSGIASPIGYTRVNPEQAASALEQAKNALTLTTPATIELRNKYRQMQRQYDTASPSQRRVLNRQMADIQGQIRAIDRAGYIAGPLALDFSKAKAEGKVFDGVDGKPRFEVDDSGAKMNDVTKVKPSNGEYLKLDDVLDHPKLFEQYPQLKDIPVTVKKERGSMASISSAKLAGKERYAMTISPTADKGTVLHEVQHLIQGQEGFARGGASNEFKTKSIPQSLKSVDFKRFSTKNQIRARLKEAGVSLPNVKNGDISIASIENPLVRAEAQKYAPELLAQYDELNAQLGKYKTATSQYERLAGEAESRAVESRMNMPMSERYKMPDNTLYHGTTRQWDGEPAYPLYTTPNKDYANIYATSTAASSLAKSGDRTAQGSFIKEFQLNPKARVLDATDPKVLKKLNDEYFGKWSTSDKFYPGKDGHLDWTEGESLAEWISETKQPYDAIKLAEGGGGVDPSSGLKVPDKGISVMALNKNALKKAKPRSTFYDSLDVPKEDLIIRNEDGKAMSVDKVDPLESLKQEARKYKSAEEFVKAQGKPVYHGSNKRIRDLPKLSTQPETNDMMGRAFYVTDSKNHGGYYARRKNGDIVNELVVTKDANIVGFDDSVSNKLRNEQSLPVWVKTNRDAYNYLKVDKGIDDPNTVFAKSGIDGFTQRLSKYDPNNQLLKEQGDSLYTAIINPNKLQTPQQLTDLYNQAQKETTVPKAKSVETPLQKSNRLHEEKLRKHNLTQNEYAALHDKVRDLDQRANELHRKVGDAIQKAIEEANGKPFPPKVRKELKAMVDEWGKALDDHVEAINQIRKIDGQKPIPRANQSQSPKSTPNKPKVTEAEVVANQNNRHFEGSSADRPLPDYKAGDKVSTYTMYGEVSGVLKKVPDYNKSHLIKGNNFVVKLDKPLELPNERGTLKEIVTDGRGFKTIKKATPESSVVANPNSITEKPSTPKPEPKTNLVLGEPTETPRPKGFILKETKGRAGRKDTVRIAPDGRGGLKATRQTEDVINPDAPDFLQVNKNDVPNVPDTSKYSAPKLPIDNPQSRLRPQSDMTAVPLENTGVTRFNEAAPRQIKGRVKKDAVVKSVLGEISKSKGKGNVEASIIAADLTTKAKRLGVKLDRKFIDKYQAGALDTPAEKQMGAAIKQVTDELFKKQQALDPTIQYRKNYIPQSYAQDAATVEEATKRLAKTTGAANRRTFNTYKEAESFGLTPRDKSLEQMLGHAASKVEQVAQNRKVVQKGMEGGIFTTNQSGGTPLMGVFAPDGSQLYAKKQVADVINGVLQKDSTGLAKAIAKTAHAFGVAQDVMLQGGVPGTNANFFVAGQMVKDTTRNIGKAPLHPIQATKQEGHLLGDFFRGNKGTQKRFAEGTFKAGGKQIKNSDFVRQMADRGLYIQPQTKLTGEGKNIVARGWNKLGNNPTFGRYMPNRMLSTAQEVYTQSVKKLGHDKALDLAAETTKTFTGHVDTILKGRSGLTEDVAGIFLFAPKYRESILGALGNVVKSTYPTNWSNPKFKPSRQLLAGMAVTLGAYELMNRELTGHSMMQNRPGQELSVEIPYGEKDDKGNQKVLNIPFMPGFMTIPRAAFSAANALRKGDAKGVIAEAGKALSAPMQDATAIIGNRDYFGNPIYIDKATAEKEGVSPDSAFTASKKIGGYLFGQLSPSWVRGGQQLAAGKPKEQAIATALEAPLKFGKRLNPDTVAYFDRRDKFTATLNKNEKAMFDKINPSKKNIRGEDIKDEGTLVKASNYADLIAHPEFADKYQAYQKSAPSHDPLWDLNKNQLRSYMQAQVISKNNPGGDGNTVRQLYDRLPKDFFATREKYFADLKKKGVKFDSKNKPNPGMPDKLVAFSEAYHKLPYGTGARKAALNSPAGKEYIAWLEQNKIRNNQERADLGLPPLEDKGSSYGGYSKGGGGGGRKGSGGGGRKGSGTAKLASVLKASNAAIKPPAKPKSPGIKVKTSNVPTTFKKAPLKKYAVAKVTVGKSRR